MNENVLTRPFQVVAYVPPVFRYLERRYVDDFFKSGTLQLNTFIKFRTHPDERRHDGYEGTGTIHYCINGEPVHTDIEAGLDSYVLCASLVYAPQLYTDFRCDSCIEIKDPLKFANLVALKLQDVCEVFFGPCQYMPNRDIDRHTESNVECRNDSDFRALCYSVFSGVDAHVLFRKHNDFRPQYEYRFLWAVENVCAPLVEPICIHVPEAVALCRRWDLES